MSACTFSFTCLDHLQEQGRKKKKTRLNNTPLSELDLLVSLSQVARHVYSRGQEPAGERLGVIRYSSSSNLCTTSSIRLHRHPLSPPRSLPLPLSLFVAEFRSGKAPILIATDVASRGLGRFWGFQCYTITT